MLEARIARSADSVVVPSKYLKEVVKAWGVNDAHITVAYNSFVPHVVDDTSSREVVRAQYGYRGTVIVSAGRLVPWKGFKGLIDVTSRLRKERHDVMCIIVGDGPDRESLKRYVQEVGVENGVRLVGAVSQEELYRYMYSADIFALNTGYEGLSHMLLEAMAGGVPIVTTDVLGNTELITHNREGILVPYDNRDMLHDALLRLIKNKDEGRAFVAHAHALVRTFTKERLFDVLVPILEKTHDSA
jgi:glycosyltransferase involved in cell wall biosynthesis